MHHRWMQTLKSKRCKTRPYLTVYQAWRDPVVRKRIPSPQNGAQFPNHSLRSKTATIDRDSSHFSSLNSWTKCSLHPTNLRQISGLPLASSLSIIITSYSRVAVTTRLARRWVGTTLSPKSAIGRALTQQTIIQSRFRTVTGSHNQYVALWNL